jgi:hypothetical protein
VATLFVTWLSLIELPTLRRRIVSPVVQDDGPPVRRCQFDDAEVVCEILELYIAVVRERGARGARFGSVSCRKDQRRKRQRPDTADARIASNDPERAATVQTTLNAEIGIRSNNREFSSRL